MRCVLAIDERGGLGKHGTIPWSCPEDLKRFRALTDTATMIMGSKTFFSLPINRRPLPGKHRTSVVLTYNPNDSKFDPYRKFENLAIVDYATVERYFDRANVVVIGGAEIFRALKRYIDTLHLSIIRGNYQCDTFARVDFSEWNIVHQEDFPDHTYYVLQKTT